MGLDNIQVSVVLPCLNEESALSLCINKIKEVFAREGITGEIIVADNNSADNSREIALSLGARVIIEPQKGYGAAYLSGLKEAKGEYIVIADSDNTYDFYDMPKFLKPLKDGYDFVLGSRFKGKIKKGAMTWSHRYIGNPILSGMCRLFFRTRLSDIHCGMRSFTNAAYKKMKLRTMGMEFATEMVVSALAHNLRTFEVPINYYPREGESKLSPFSDAWRHIRFMLIYSPLWLYFMPALTGFLLGIVILLLLLKGPFLFLGHQWDIHFMIFISAISILSYQLLNLGIFAHTFAINEGFLRNDRFFIFFQRNFNLEKGLMIGTLLFIAGISINLLIFIEWFFKHFGTLARLRESILAMTLLIIGLQTIFSSFFISLLFLKRK
ncbi:MAG: glycosyltransferase family 2 protein [Candidatus Omnitrophota bacterium]|nr:glycosyltransferase family 2 protein [Candidatus Omnitrophota bacterium]MBU1929402.1 glycosyltransferase family 2 protein [Candidatus Omnitrophota bacterium]MBU2034277.1 glycosyltransferase family 2 protein [Candidatus Omnitrophota bacterium]